ncbi:hypothetical protein GWK47_015365 [Chionoecetes opilio]|uniref:Uncharacterized protein n=1 Tax=Chionoecetes opilio TaxID=41210 RepID=A0A8J5CIC6_CHIOP|nr:hypothetical protein GWK47_015365 [Chionoecetes opilio]
MREEDPSSLASAAARLPRSGAALNDLWVRACSQVFGLIATMQCPVPVDTLSRVLARVLIGRESTEAQRASANRLGELLILCYNDIFQAGGEVVQEPEDFSDSVSSPDSPGDSREEGIDDADDDDADTTTTDTDDFRSPPVSPLKGERLWGSSGIRAPSSLPLHPPALSSRIRQVGKDVTAGMAGTGPVCIMRASRFARLVTSFVTLIIHPASPPCPPPTPHPSTRTTFICLICTRLTCDGREKKLSCYTDGKVWSLVATGGAAVQGSTAEVLE